MKKAVSIFLCAVLVICSVFAFSGCTKQDSITSDIVLITNGGNIDDSGVNESAWEGISSYADENGLACRYYQPVLDEDGEITVDNVEQYVKIAADNGAQYIVLPGEDFAVSAYEIAPSYPDVNFILLGAIPHSQGDSTDRYISNVMSVSFDALQSGFLAGYIAVATGNTKLGYFGDYKSSNSANYGAGFVQGAAYAADELGIPVTLDWADYDSPYLDYSYDLTMTACYKKIDDETDKTWTVEVENGTGSGTYTDGTNVTITADPAPEGKEFDKWEVKSITDGVKDKKVNVTSEKKETMNLIVEECDCRLTATYKDIEGDYSTVTVLGIDGSEYASYSVSENSQCEVTAPVASENMIFDHWESDVDGAIAQEDIENSTITVSVTDKDVTLTPVYTISDSPTFNVSVVTGEGGDGDSQGSGSYSEGDTVTISAAVPKDGYMFSHWESKNADDTDTDIALDNEYYWSTTFEMTDRYASVCEKMYNEGVELIFAGGNSTEASVYTAKDKFDSSPLVIASDINNDAAYCSILNNYGEAVKDCLSDFKGGTVAAADCKTNGISASYVSDDEEVNASYEKVYKKLADGKILLTSAQGGASMDFCSSFAENQSSACLTLNGWFKNIPSK